MQINNNEQLKDYLTHLAANNDEYRNFAKALLRQPLFADKSGLKDQIWQVYNEWFKVKFEFMDIENESAINRISDFLIKQNDSIQSKSIEMFKLILSNYKDKEPSLYKLSFNISSIIIKMRFGMDYSLNELTQYNYERQRIN